MVRLGRNFPNAALTAAVMLAAHADNAYIDDNTPNQSIRAPRWRRSGTPTMLGSRALKGGSGSVRSTPKE
ncbi:MAG: hypothetical protein WA488_22135 [Mycobacterium sp.]|uniref:hypothetical protein n=1 Tax=Mycobacterium sp. TaxID=1785 RepID=UPI003BB7B34A